MKHIGMIKKWIAKLAWLVTLVASLVVVLSGCESNVTEEENIYASAAEALSKVTSYELNLLQTESPAQAIQKLAFSAGTSSADWAFCYLTEQYPELLENTDLMKFYEKALLSKAESLDLNGIELQRIALCLAKTGCENTVITDFIDRGSTTPGIMATIYALRVHNSGEFSSLISSEQLLAKLLERQQASGAFGLSEKQPDVDVTAMALQALAPHYRQFEKEIRLALQFLGRAQEENGGFSSMGVSNSESIAQVLTAVAMLKNEVQSHGDAFLFEEDLLDARIMIGALLEYQNDDGSVCHVAGDGGNAMASMQAWGALLAFQKSYKEPPKPQYNLGVTLGQRIAGELSAHSGFQLRLMLTFMIVLALLVTCLYMIFNGQKKLKHYLVALGISVVLIVLVFVLRIENPQEYRDRIAAEEGTIETTIEIRGVDDVILSQTTVHVQANGTAFDQLNLALTKEQIPMNYSGNAMFANIYVQSINGLAERAYGETSGWMYSVNGEYPQVGCSSYSLRAGDVVIWHYSTGGEVVE